jgi:tetratricopeptide (TPR) repeat protein
MTVTRRARPHRLLALFLSLAAPAIVPAIPRSALAQAQPKTDPKAEAARMKKEADALMDQDKYAEALALYAKAFEITGDPALLYNQGRAHEAMGDYPEALDELERFEREAPPALQKKVTGLRDHLDDLRRRIATLVVTTNAPGARLMVREKAAGLIDRQTRVRTRAGPATIEVTAEGYEPFHTSVELPGGVTVPIDAQLVPKKRAPEEALIIVRTRPPADIAVDGRALGRAPLEAKLAPGSYVLTANAEGYREERVPMTLSLGDRREVDLELRKPAPIVARWWFWTGLAVLAAGGAATYFALTIERSPSEGTFRPGSVPGP